jgi:hypothetical protein
MNKAVNVSKNVLKFIETNRFNKRSSTDKTKKQLYG